MGVRKAPTAKRGPADDINVRYAVHRGKIEQLNVDKIMTEFVLRNDERRKTFAVPHC